MRYGGVSQDEMEVTIRLDREDRQAHICSTWPEWSRKLERLYGCPKKETHRGDCITSAFWIVPINRVSVRRAPKARQFSEEQRTAARDRMRRLHRRPSLPSTPD